MIKHFYGALIATSFFVNTAYGYNYKMLYLEADTFVSRLCSGTPIKLDMLKESLEDLKTKEDMGSKYSHPNFPDEIVSQVEDEKFSRFAALCKSASTEGDEPTRVAAGLLLERVANQYKSFLKYMERRSRPVDLSKCYTHTSSLNFPELLNIFATADQSLGLIPTRQ